MSIKRGNYSIFHCGYLVIKSIAYFPLQCAQNSGAVMEAVLDCFQANGIQTQENSMTADAVVIWSVLWYGRMRQNREVYEHYRKQGKPVVIVEIGALYRGQTWKIAVNNITASGYYGHTENLDLDRPTKLGISLAQTFHPKPNIIIAAQHRHSLQVAGLTSIEDWIVDQIAQLRTVTDRPITIRPHPRSPLQAMNWGHNVSVEHPRPVANTYDSFDMHFDCHAVVNYSSGPGIQAAISGSRPIVDASSLAHPVAVTVGNIEQPYEANREQWLIEICHTEYTLEEIKRGSWFPRILPAL